MSDDTEDEAAPYLSDFDDWPDAPLLLRPNAVDRTQVGVGLVARTREQRSVELGLGLRCAGCGACGCP